MNEQRKIIKKEFETLTEAINFKYSLYSKYKSVRIHDCPLFGWDGEYEFSVSND